MCRFYRRVNKERRDCSSAQWQHLSTRFNSTVPAKTIISKATGFSLIDFSCHIVALLQGTILVSFHTNTEMEIFKKICLERLSATNHIGKRHGCFDSARTTLCFPNTTAAMSPRGISQLCVGSKRTN